MKIVSILFLVFLLISSMGFLLPEQFTGWLDSIFGSYSWFVSFVVLGITIVLAIIIGVYVVVTRNK